MEKDFIEAKTYQYSIPTWAICALEYGDYSGLNDEDIKNIESFLDGLPELGGTFTYNDEKYFSNSPAFGLPCDCVDVEYTILYLTLK